MDGPAGAATEGIDLAGLTESMYFNLARGVRKLKGPLAVEMAVSDFLGIVDRAMGAVPPERFEETREDFLAGLIGCAIEDENTYALATLRALAVVGPESVRGFAAGAADEMAAEGVPDRAWARVIGMPTVGRCWWYGDPVGQVGVVLTFRYGDEEHSLNVLIDNDAGDGGILDSWVGDQPDLTWAEAERVVTQTPGMSLETIGWARARDLLTDAMTHPACPVEQDQVDTLAATAGVLRARVALLHGDIRPPVIWPAGTGG